MTNLGIHLLFISWAGLSQWGFLASARIWDHVGPKAGMGRGWGPQQDFPASLISLRRWRSEAAPWPAGDVVGAFVFWPSPVPCVSQEQQRGMQRSLTYRMFWEGFGEGRATAGSLGTSPEAA